MDQPARDWIDVGNFIVLLLAFLAAAAAAYESYRLAGLTQTAIEHADQAGKDQHEDTVSAFKRADEANRIAKESADRQLHELSAATQVARITADAAKTQADAFIAAESGDPVLAENGGVQLIRSSTTEAESGPITAGLVPTDSILEVAIQNIGKSPVPITRLDVLWEISSGPPARTLPDKFSIPLNTTLAVGKDVQYTLNYPIQPSPLDFGNMQHGSTLWVRLTINYLDLLLQPRARTFIVGWDQTRGFHS